MQIVLQIVNPILNSCPQWLPARATAGSAGYDLSCPIEVTIPAGAIEFIHSGLSMHISDPAYVGILASRSGLGTKGIVIAQGVGVIDSDYRGEIIIPLLNRRPEPYLIIPGDRVAQLLFVPVAHPALAGAAIQTHSERGTGGFGSTDDPVNHPRHYERHAVTVEGRVYEPFDLLRYLPFSLGCAFKYIIRHHDKGTPAEDLAKAVWYLNRYLQTGWPHGLRPPPDKLWQAFRAGHPLLGLITEFPPSVCAVQQMINACKEDL